MAKLKIVNLKLWPVNIIDIKQKNVMRNEYYTKDQQKVQELQSTNWEYCYLML